METRVVKPWVTPSYKARGNDKNGGLGYQGILLYTTLNLPMTSNVFHIINDVIFISGVYDVIRSCQIDIIIKTCIIIIIRLAYFRYAGCVVVRCEVEYPDRAAVTSMLYQIIHVPQSLLRITISWQTDTNETGSYAVAYSYWMPHSCLP